MWLVYREGRCPGLFLAHTARPRAPSCVCGAGVLPGILGGPWYPAPIGTYSDHGEQDQGPLQLATHAHGELDRMARMAIAARPRGKIRAQPHLGPQPPRWRCHALYTKYGCYVGCIAAGAHSHPHRGMAAGFPAPTTADDFARPRAIALAASLCRAGRLYAHLLRFG